MSAKELSKLISNYYKDNPSGGNCHIVLDHQNINDSNIIFCLEECRKNNDIVGFIIMNHMLSMKKTARLKAINMWRVNDN